MSETLTYHRNLTIKPNAPTTFNELNVTGIPHDALRVYVMGERAVAEEAANDDDIARMRGLLREALEAGAVGFSTGRSDNHRSAVGDWTPASEAEAKELAGIAQAFDGLGYGVLQAVSDFNILHGDEHFDAEWAVLEEMLAGRACGLNRTVSERTVVATIERVRGGLPAPETEVRTANETNGTPADMVTWAGEQWEVVKVETWPGSIAHHKALCMRVSRP